MTRNRNTVTSEKNGDTVAAPDLRVIRESLGLTLENLFQRTRISVDNLQAIETQDFRCLPPPVYTRTFIRQYAKVLGIDEKKIMSRYEKYLESLKTPPLLAEEIRRPRRLAKVNYRTVVPLLSLVIIGSVILLLSLNHKSDVDIPHNPLPPQKTMTAAAPETTSLPAPPARDKATGMREGKGTSPGFPRPPAAPAESKAVRETPSPSGGKTGPVPDTIPAPPYLITIEARELTWLRISSDREPSYQVLLRPGEKIERQARAPFTLDIGNAGGVNVMFQGRPLGSLGKPGEVVHIRLP